MRLAPEMWFLMSANILRRAGLTQITRPGSHLAAL
jgi:hypothetical protein